MAFIHSLWFGESTTSWKEVSSFTSGECIERFPFRFESIDEEFFYVHPVGSWDPIICLSSWRLSPPFFKRCRNPNLWRITPTIPLRREIVYVDLLHSQVDFPQVIKDESRSLEQAHHPGWLGKNSNHLPRQEMGEVVAVTHTVRDSFLFHQCLGTHPQGSRHCRNQFMSFHHYGVPRTSHILWNVRDILWTLSW